MQTLKHTNSMLLTMSKVAVGVVLLGLDWFRKFSVALLVALQACAGNASASDISGTIATTLTIRRTAGWLAM